MTAAKSPSKPRKGSGFRRKSARGRQVLKSDHKESHSIKPPKLLSIEVIKKVLPQINLNRITSIDYEVCAKELQHRRQRQLFEKDFPAGHRIKHQNLSL